MGVTIMITVDEAHLTVGDTGVSVKGRHYKYSDIDRIYFHYVETHRTTAGLYTGSTHSVTVDLYGRGMGEQVMITKRGRGGSGTPSD